MLSILVPLAAAGQSAARNVSWAATNGSLAIPFTYTVTYQADNMPAQTAVISVPFHVPSLCSDPEA